MYLKLGENGYVECGNRPDLSFEGFRNYTFAAWVRMNEQGKGGTLWAKSDGKTRVEYLVYIDGNRKVQAYRNVEDWFATSQTIIEPHQWVHIATTYEAPVRGPWPQRFPSRLYINGKIEAEMYSTSIPGFRNTPFTVGGGYDKERRLKSFGGDIRDLRIWDRALSEAEIQLEMASSSPQHTGLVSWFDFQKTSGPQEAGATLAGGAQLIDETPVIDLSSQSQITQHYWTSFYEPLTDANIDQIAGEIEPDGTLAFYASIANPLNPDLNGLTFRLSQDHNGTGWKEESLNLKAVATKLYHSKYSGSEKHELVALGEVQDGKRELSVWTVRHQEGTVTKRKSIQVEGVFDQLYTHVHEHSNQTTIFLTSREKQSIQSIDIENYRNVKLMLTQQPRAFIERMEPERYLKPKRSYTADYYYLSHEGRFFAFLESVSSPIPMLEEIPVSLPYEGIKDIALTEDPMENTHVFLIDQQGLLQYGHGTFGEFQSPLNNLSWTQLFEGKFKGVKCQINRKILELYLTTEKDELYYAAYDFKEWNVPSPLGVPCSSLLLCPAWNGETNLLSLKDKEMYRIHRNRDTGYWSTEKIRLEARVKTAREFLSYSTQLFVVDQDGNPMPGEEIEFEATEDTIVLLNQQTRHLRAGQQIVVPTLLNGVISVIMQVESLYTFPLKAKAVRNPQAEIILDPHRDMKRRMSSLTVDELLKAQNNGAYLVPDAYRNHEMLQKVINGVQQCLSISEPNRDRGMDPDVNAARSLPMLNDMELSDSQPLVVFDMSGAAGTGLTTMTDTNLFGGFRDWIWSVGQFVKGVFEKAVQVTKMVVEKVVDTVKATFTAIVDGITRSIKVVFEHAGQVVEAIGGIFNTIGVKMKELIHYVADKIGWNDILIAKNTYKNYLTGFFDSVETIIAVFQTKTDYLWQTLDNYRAEGFKKLKELPYYQNTTKINEEQAKYKVVHRDSRFGLVMNPLIGMLGGANDASNPSSSNERWTDVNGDLQSGTLSHSGMAVLDKLKNAVHEVTADASFGDLKARISQIAANPQQLHGEGIALLVDIMDLILSAAVKGAKVMMNILFDILKDVVRALSDLLKMEFYIPFVSELYEHVTGSKLSLIDLLSFVMAISLKVFESIFNIPVNYAKMDEHKDKLTKEYFSQGIRGINSTEPHVQQNIGEINEDLIKINKSMQIGGFAWIVVSDSFNLIASFVKVGRVHKYSKQPIDTSKYPNWANMTAAEKHQAKLKEASASLDKDDTMGAFDFVNLFFSFAPLLRTALIPPVWYSEFGKEWNKGWVHAAGICNWGLQTLFSFGSVLCGSVWLIISKVMNYFRPDRLQGFRALADKISPYLSIFFQSLTTITSLSYAIISCWTEKDEKGNVDGIAIANNFVIFASYTFGTTATILGLAKSNIYVVAAAAICTGFMVASDCTSLGLTAASNFKTD